MKLFPVQLHRYGLIAALLATPPMLASCGKPVAKISPAQRPSPSDSVPVTVGTAQTILRDRTLRVVGTLYAKDEATIGAEVEGRVEKTMVDFGDRIKAGQLIAQIDTTSYQALADQASANVARAKATFANAEHNLKRTRELSKNNIASPSDLDKAVAESDQANATVQAAEAELAVAQLNVEKSRVKAPWTGAVADRVATSGDYVKAGAPLFRVVNDSVFKYIVQAPEAYAGLIRKEQRVLLEVDAFPGQKFEGRVYLISPQVNITTRGFAFGALVQNQDLKLKANSFARGEAILEQGVPTLVVPLEAVVTFSGISKVFVVKDGIAHARQVETGRITNGQQEILSGVKENEIVVLTGQTKLFEGAQVRLKGNEAGPAQKRGNQNSETKPETKL